MDEPKTLWLKVFAALSWQLPSIDRSPGERLNRLVREYFPELTTIVEEVTCNIRFEMRSVSNIKQLEVWHDRAEPKRLGDEIIIFSHLGRSVVVDGNNRVNAHLNSNGCEPMPAIIIELR
jgi:hypothetical protein